MIHIHELGLQPYLPILEKMRQFTQARTADSPDELWLLEHESVYTQGQAGKPEYLLNAQSIPVVHSDRGGQITYHGPGQLVGYFLFDLKRRHMGIRTFVHQLEEITIKLLSHYHISGERQCGAPGIYVQNKKIASLGLRVKQGCTYHGIALNVNMDLSPFKGIHPCGFSKLEMTQLSDYIPHIDMQEVMQKWVDLFLHQFEKH